MCLAGVLRGALDIFSWWWWGGGFVFNVICWQIHAFRQICINICTAMLILHHCTLKCTQSCVIYARLCVNNAHTWLYRVRLVRGIHVWSLYYRNNLSTSLLLLLLLLFFSSVSLTCFAIIYCRLFPLFSRSWFLIQDDATNNFLALIYCWWFLCFTVFQSFELFLVLFSGYMCRKLYFKTIRVQGYQCQSGQNPDRCAAALGFFGFSRMTRE